MFNRGVAKTIAIISALAVAIGTGVAGLTIALVDRNSVDNIRVGDSVTVTNMNVNAILKKAKDKLSLLPEMRWKNFNDKDITVGEANQSLTRFSSGDLSYWELIYALANDKKQNLSKENSVTFNTSDFWNESLDSFSMGKIIFDGDKYDFSNMEAYCEYQWIGADNDFMFAISPTTVNEDFPKNIDFTSKYYSGYELRTIDMTDPPFSLDIGSIVDAENIYAQIYGTGLPDDGSKFAYWRNKIATDSDYTCTVAQFNDELRANMGNLDEMLYYDLISWLALNTLNKNLTMYTDELPGMWIGKTAEQTWWSDEPDYQFIHTSFFFNAQANIVYNDDFDSEKTFGYFWFRDDINGQSSTPITVEYAKNSTDHQWYLSITGMYEDEFSNVVPNKTILIESNLLNSTDTSKIT
ncbi:MAG: hypothetical protein LBS76_04730 [Mycoplasmataceae bacterium]|nr:hypothetical protein [Mycoplasmataceae bacterium]